MSVAENIRSLKSSLPADVTLVAVSKTKSEEQIQEAYAAGQRDFGENYVQELTEKAASLPKDIRWHFIGHLQSNKVKFIAPFVHLIHGVDSFKLLQEINKQAKKNNRIISCLLQVFIASEETKFGLDETELHEILLHPELKLLTNIHIIGLMGMSSNTDDNNKIKTEFLKLKQLHDSYPDLSVLSMGMSGDYQLAIACGSNMIRVGSLLFGERDYSEKKIPN